MPLKSEEVGDEKTRVGIELVDYGRVRDEIDKRTALSAQLLNFQIILIAAVFSGYGKIPEESLIVVSCLSSVLWLMWIDHTSQIYKLAAYAEIVIARRLRDAYPGVLGWESFMRRLESDQARAVLFPDKKHRIIDLPKTEHITHYIRVLFSGSALALAGFYVRAVWPIDELHELFLLVAVVAWGYAAVANQRLIRSCHIISDAITSTPAPSASID